MAEDHVRSDVGLHGLPAVVVRPGILVGADGPGLDAVNAIVLGRRLVLLGGAAGSPPLIDLECAAELILRAGYDSALTAGTVLHMVDRQNETERALAARLARARGLRLWRIPAPALRAAAAAVTGLARACRA